MQLNSVLQESPGKIEAHLNAQAQGRLIAATKYASRPKKHTLNLLWQVDYLTLPIQVKRSIYARSTKIDSRDFFELLLKVLTDAAQNIPCYGNYFALSIDSNDGVKHLSFRYPQLWKNVPFEIQLYTLEHPQRRIGFPDPDSLSTEEIDRIWSNSKYLDQFAGSTDKVIQIEAIFEGFRTHEQLYMTTGRITSPIMLRFNDDFDCHAIRLKEILVGIHRDLKTWSELQERAATALTKLSEKDGRLLGFLKNALNEYEAEYSAKHSDRNGNTKVTAALKDQGDVFKKIHQVWRKNNELRKNIERVTSNQPTLVKILQRASSPPSGAVAQITLDENKLAKRRRIK